MSAYADDLQALACIPLAQLSEEHARAICGGRIKTNKTIMTKKGDPMAFITIEDTTGTAEIIVFPKLYRVIEPLLEQYTVFVITGSVDVAGGTPKIKAEDMVPLDTIYLTWQNQLIATLTLPTTIAPTQLGATLELLQAGQTKLNLVYYERERRLQLTSRKKITVTRQMITALRQFGIETSVTIERVPKKPWVPKTVLHGY